MFKALAIAIAVSASLSGPLLAQDTEAEAADPPVAAEVVAPASEDGDAIPELVITEAGEQELDDFMWYARPLVIFADSPNDPRFVKQMAFLQERPGELIERDVIVITDTDPAARSPIREELRPRGFDLVLIGKDGFKYLRKPLPWNVREISRSIDKMPLRQQELKDQRGK
jgi:hypothetical protein